MTKLNLTANGRSQELILAYLQENASEVLTDKINNGTPFEKDGKKLINRKTLDGFMKFASDEAKKLAKKGEISACVEDSVVYGWAIQYFEEESIEGKLYNEDGTEYEPPKPVKKATEQTTPNVPYTPPAPKPKPQMSIFDMLDGQSQPEEKPVVAVENDEDEDEFTAEELEEIYAEEQARENERKKGSPMYRHYLSVKEKYKDSIVFYRLGDFYEMFGQDAITSANELNLTLTGRDCGLAERVPMTGVPFHAAEVYIAKLIDKGYKVAVAEPLGDGKPDIERAIEPKPLPEPVVDVETGEILSGDIEELSETDMRRSDGDIAEPEEEIPTVSKITDILNEDDFEQDLESARAIDPECLCILLDLIENLTVQ